MKRILSALLVPAAVVTAFAAPTVDQVAVRQNWPWSTDLKVDFNLTGVDTPADVFVSYYSGNTPISPDGSAATNGNQAACVGLTGIAEGGQKSFAVPVANRFAGYSKEVPDFRVELEAVDSESGKYLVFDLSAGKDADSYPHFFTNEMSAAVLADDACRTTQLWLRRIPKGAFEVGVPDAAGDQPLRTHYGSAVIGAFYSLGGMYGNQDHRGGPTTLSEDFYIGVFELTQKQCAQICGNAYSYITTGNCYPAGLTWANLRGEDVGPTSVAHWPTNASAMANSIIGKLRVKTGFSGFDLPTNAQWERAARGNTGSMVHTALPDGGETGLWAESMDDPNLAAIACCNQDAPARVGSYLANGYGLYDMIGNMWEWALDAWCDNASTRTYSCFCGTDPVGPVGEAANGTWKHVLKGGRYNHGKSGDAPAPMTQAQTGYQAYLTIYNRCRNTTAATGGGRLVVNLHPYAKD